MIDPRLAWFAIGAAFSATVLGWPWHSRFNRRMDPPRGSWRGTRSISFPDPEPGRQPTNPFTGGPVKPQPPSGRVVDIHGRTIGRIPRSQGDTPNPPPTAP